MSKKDSERDGGTAREPEIVDSAGTEDLAAAPPSGFVAVKGSRFASVNRHRKKQLESHSELVRAGEGSVNAQMGLERAIQEYNGLSSEFEVGRLKREIELINLRAERDRLRESKETEQARERAPRDERSKAQRIIDDALGDIATLQEFDRQAKEILANTPPEDRERVEAILDGARERFLRERGA